MIKIAIDCMGGDIGLSVTVPAAVYVANKYPDTQFLLVGPTDQVQATLHKAHPRNLDQFHVINATEVVTMEDSVEVALRRKKDSSMRVAIDCVKNEQADVCVSAGNTGALMAVSRFVLKMMDGIDRPAIATALPNAKGTGTTVLDLGANVDCTAQHLLEFAYMGSAFVQAVDQIESPTVGLLNVGSELIKGNEVVKQAFTLLQDSRLNFVGNVEGDDIFKGTSHVVVCDGFVGNSLLKAIEGLVRMIGGSIRTEFKRNIFTLTVALFTKPILNKIRKRMDNRRYNGAALLGLRGVVIKSHGSADVISFSFALERARNAVEHDVLTKISQGVKAIQATQPA